MAVIPTGEKWSASEQLGKDATDGPYIYGLCVHLKREHDLGCAVPSCCYIFSHQTDFFAWRNARFDTTSKPKIANFEIAVGIQEEIGRFQISMDNICGVNGFKSTKSLVDEILDELVKGCENMHGKLT